MSTFSGHLWHGLWSPGLCSMWQWAGLTKKMVSNLFIHTFICQDAIQLSLGSFYPNLLLSGIIWPLEGMPDYLRWDLKARTRSNDHGDDTLNLFRYISYVLPQTFACQALRGIMSRGWGLEWTPVYRGFLVTLAWITALLAISTIVLKIRR